MRTFICISGLCLSSLMAQDISKVEMSNLDGVLEKIQNMQLCLSKIDLNSLADVETEALQVQKEVKQMCIQDKRDQAQKKATLFYINVTSIPAIIQMKKCTENIIILETDIKNKQHVCDTDQLDLGIPSKKRISW